MSQYDSEYDVKVIGGGAAGLSAALVLTRARDVLHCPYCHGHEVRDRLLGVIGGTAGAVRYAQIVRQWTHDLVYFTPPEVLTATERTELLARAIGVVEGTVDALVIDDADHLRPADARRLRHSPRRAVPLRREQQRARRPGLRAGRRRLGRCRGHRTHQRR